MQYEFWQERWQEGRIGFHEFGGNANLREHWQHYERWWRAGAAAASQHVLVPLCGKSLDLGWLASQGHQVVGVEFVESAVVDFFAEAGVNATRHEQGSRVRYEHGDISILVADFFELEAADVGAVDTVYDRAALVAVPPEQRKRYVEQLARLTRPGAGLFVITFEHDMQGGPPFSVGDVGQLLAPHFEFEQRSVQNILDAESRFRERGATFLSEAVWFARRSGTLDG